MIAHRGEGEDLVHPGEHGELLGLDPLQTGPVEQLGEVVADVAPGILEPSLRIDLLRHQTVGDTGWFVAELDLKCVSETVSRIRRHDERAMPFVSRAQGGRSRHGGLAHPALSRHEDDPHCEASERFLSPRSALDTICFSAWRRRNPGTLKAGSTFRA